MKKKINGKIFDALRAKDVAIWQMIVMKIKIYAQKSKT